MDTKEKNEVFSKAVKAGKRTYFFDVKTTKNNENYLTITESIRKFDEVQNKFVYDKHKLFLYKEDFEKFSTALTGMVNFVEKGEIPDDDFFKVEESPYKKESVDIKFEDLEQ